MLKRLMIFIVLFGSSASLMHGMDQSKIFGGIEVAGDWQDILGNIVVNQQDAVDAAQAQQAWYDQKYAEQVAAQEQAARELYKNAARDQFEGSMAAAGMQQGFDVYAQSMADQQAAKLAEEMAKKLAQQQLQETTTTTTTETQQVLDQTAQQAEQVVDADKLPTVLGQDDSELSGSQSQSGTPLFATIAASFSRGISNFNDSRLGWLASWIPINKPFSGTQASRYAPYSLIQNSNNAALAGVVGGIMMVGGLYYYFTAGNTIENKFKRIETVLQAIEKEPTDVPAGLTLKTLESEWMQPLRKAHKIKDELIALGYADRIKKRDAKDESIERRLEKCQSKLEGWETELDKRAASEQKQSAAASSTTASTASTTTTNSSSSSSSSSSLAATMAAAVTNAASSSAASSSSSSSSDVSMTPGDMAAQKVLDKLINIRDTLEQDNRLAKERRLEQEHKQQEAAVEKQRQEVEISTLVLLEQILKDCDKLSFKKMDTTALKQRIENYRSQSDRRESVLQNERVIAMSEEAFIRVKQQDPKEEGNDQRKRAKEQKDLAQKIQDQLKILDEKIKQLGLDQQPEFCGVNINAIRSQIQTFEADHKDEWLWMVREPQPKAEAPKAASATESKRSTAPAKKA